MSEPATENANDKAAAADSQPAGGGPTEATALPGPQRTFRLRQALDAQRQGDPAAEFAEFAHPAPSTTSPSLVDLTPVRQALQAAAERRSLETQAGGGDATAARVAALPRQPDTPSRIGVLLINLGTPEAPTAKAVRRYLREFLSDRRVIEKNTLVWRMVLKGLILPLRPRIKAHAYRAIWNKVENESPIKTTTRAQATKLAATLAGLDGSIVVDWAMRYGLPAIEPQLRAMIAQGCGRIVVIPLYPQYSSATTATACDEVFRVLGRLRNQPALRTAPAYYDDPVYIEAVAASIEAELTTLSFKPDAILASFHGMPLDYVQKGDPYYQQCVATTKLLRARLGMSERSFILTFQSRFGRAEWLKPYTSDTLRKLAKEGARNVAVVTPGFSADCLETLEEIAMENARLFRKKGGKNFAFVPCLNDSERGMQVIREIAARELKGWV